MRLQAMLHARFAAHAGELWLAIDASCAQATLALLAPTRGLWEASLAAKAYPSEQLLPTLIDLLQQAQAPAQRLSGIVVGLGPGSFTGLRVALSTVKGLALGLGCPVWGTSSLRMHAAAVARAGQVLVVRDARREHFYGQRYRVDGQGQAHAEHEVRLWPIRELAQQMRGVDVVCDEPQALHQQLPNAPTLQVPMRAAYGFLAEAERIEQKRGDALAALVPDYQQQSVAGM